ncbi:RDD family protein [Mucilaginibacter sp. ZT4R22]|uniref:RDD family protein n=1 Tax=Mucilaginibacter pankratovii TaxID=2772110 RepID=A0ABR7WQ31_9SPHI|nr:RDD family protein [Mucilaginibacter pankratovii]MBD1364438.1 RDD family protein [Mucilaginibacter pankratovii]
MSTLNLPAIKQSLIKKTDDQLIKILSTSQNDYEVGVMPIIREILLDRGLSEVELHSYDTAYLSSKNNVANQPRIHSPASFVARLCQYVIDHLAFFGICYLLQLSLSILGVLTDAAYDAGCLALYLLYYCISLGTNSATPGMSALGLKVVTKEKGDLNYELGFIRGVFMLLNFFTLQLGHMWMLIEKDKRTAVDIFSKTMVVYDK